MFRSLLLLVAGMSILSSPPSSQAAMKQPNIVVIVADDLGYADLGCQGCKDVPTPHIDSIAKNGVRFTNGYVSCPICSPTRAGLMTGRYQQRFGHEFGLPKDAGLPVTERTLADRLKAAGYATGAFGKWHLGYQPQFHPQQRGFDEFFGFLGGAHSYVEQADNSDPVLRGVKPVEQVRYTTDEFAQEAVQFIERHRKEPFFVYLPFNAVHAPMDTLPKYLNRFPDIKDAKRQKFAAMLSAMDDGVGSVLAKLREAKLEDNTLVFFFSDNGGPTKQTSSSNAPLSGYKTEVFEGGIRIPFLVQWPGKIPAGKVYDSPIIALDICPTALAAAGVAEPADAKFDGVNLLPYLDGEKKDPPHAVLYWRFGSQRALRSGSWKLLDQGNGVKLFDLAADVGEKDDLAAKHPEKLKEFQAVWDKWNSELEEPRWGKEKKK